MDPFILMWFRLSLLEDVEDFPQIMHGLANTSPTMTMDRLDINRLEMANASTLSMPESSVIKAPKREVREAQRLIDSPSSTPFPLVHTPSSSHPLPFPYSLRTVVPPISSTTTPTTAT
jgi:hypothetical protein